MSTSDREALARREALFRTCIPLAYQRAGQATPIGRRFGLTKDDLAQAALMGCWHATSKFDQARGVKFVTYAAWWVRSYIGRAIAVAEKQQLGFSAETDVSTSGGPHGVGLVELLSSLDAPDLDVGEDSGPAIMDLGSCRADGRRGQPAALRVLGRSRRWQSFTLPIEA